eukprot:1157410-Pelagomonas_calceolata.AAC.13
MNSMHMKQARLSHICGLPARGAVEDIAGKIGNLIKKCHEVALQVCTTNEKTTNSNHYKIRRISNLRKSPCNKFKSVHHVKYNLAQTLLALTFAEALAQNQHNPNLHKAILFVRSFSLAENNHTAPASYCAPPPPLPSLETVLKAQQKNLKGQINNIDAGYNAQYHTRA